MLRPISLILLAVLTGTSWVAYAKGRTCRQSSWPVVEWFTSGCGIAVCVSSDGFAKFVSAWKGQGDDRPLARLEYSAAGFKYAQGQIEYGFRMPPEFRMMVVPLLPRAVGTTILCGALCYRGWWRPRRHAQAGCCTECGYDLRGLPEPRCPECGTRAEHVAAVAAEVSAYDALCPSAPLR